MKARTYIISAVWICLVVTMLYENPMGFQLFGSYEPSHIGQASAGGII